jgi:hypothetical protein
MSLILREKEMSRPPGPMPEPKSSLPAALRTAASLDQSLE